MRTVITLSSYSSGGQSGGTGSLLITKRNRLITKCDRLISASGRAWAALPRQSLAHNPHEPRENAKETCGVWEVAHQLPQCACGRI